LSLSEQEMIDCANNGLNTCSHGGWMQDVWNYLLSHHSGRTESAYPYLATSGHACRYSSTSAPAGANLFYTSSHSLPAGDENALKVAVDNYPAIAVAIDASHSSFQFYSSGVYNEPACNPNNLDHAVSIIGYGTASVGGDYWLVRNSWGTSWGIGGYIKMKRNSGNRCGIASKASFIVH